MGKVDPADSADVDLCLYDFPLEIINRANDIIALLRGEAYACLVIADCNTGNIGVGYLNALGNIAEHGLPLGSVGIVHKGSVEVCGNIPNKSGNVNGNDIGYDRPRKVLNRAGNNVVIITCGKGCGCSITTNLGCGVGAAVGEGHALCGIGAILKSDGKRGAVVLEGAGIIPLCTADVDSLGNDFPRLRETYDSGIKLIVCGVKRGGRIYRGDHSNVLARIGSLSIGVNELNVLDTICINGFLITVIVKLCGGAPHNFGGENHLFGDINSNLVRSDGLGDNTLCNGDYTVVLAAIGNVHNVKGICGINGDVLTVGIDLVPLICVGSGG